MLAGEEAFQYLLASLEKDNDVTSSHWKKYHQDFKINSDGTLSGIVGFGGSAKPYTGIRKLLHNRMQEKYRNIGMSFPNFKELDSIAHQMTSHQGRAYDLDVLRQTLTLAYLKSKLPKLDGNSVVTVIGDGFASMTTLLLLSGFAKKVILVNLTKTLFVDLLYFQKSFSLQEGLSFALILENREMAEAMKSSSKVDAIQASNHEFLKETSSDLVINIASMQEMNNSIIQAYFEDIRNMISPKKKLYFYCCNREEKFLPDGEVTRISEYPWKLEDRILVDELCPWHLKWYKILPPKYYSYDGPIRHKLVEMIR